MTRYNVFAVAVAVAFATLFVYAGSACANTAQGDEKEGICNVLEQFFRSIAQRDIEGVGQVLHSSVICVEAASENSTVEVLDPSKPEVLLPPKENDDWENVKISDVSVRISSTHPSVAVVSFTIAFEVGEEERKMIQNAPDEVISQLDEEQKKRLEKILHDKSWNASMFALMGKKRGEWKIVSMSLPK